MENDQFNQELYQQGFNEGYILAKHLPDLASSLAKIENQSERIEGFRDGRHQFALEQIKEHRPAWLKEDTHKSPVKEKDISKDRDIDEEADL